MNWRLILCIFLLISCGIITLYSITFNLPDPFWKKQLLWAFLGMIGLFITSLINYTILKRYALLIYIISIILLIAVLFTSPIRSTHSWFTFFGLSFQPSEFAKISTIIMLSSYLSDKKQFSSPSSFIPPFIIILIPISLILLQPDLGSTSIFIPCLFSMLYILPNTNKAWLYFLFFLFILSFFFVILSSFFIFKGYKFLPILLISIPFFISLFYRKKSVFLIFLCLIFSFFFSISLKDYQRKRLIAFLDQSFAPLEEGYNIIQSKIAIGGGGIFGMGFLKGSQSHLGFLPESTSDFIFSVYAEEWGLIGVVFLISLFFYLITISLSITSSSVDIFGSLIAVGITTMIGASVFINIGVASGILPVTGIPLPFISYGGSSLLCNMISVGILISIQRRSRILNLELQKSPSLHIP